MPHDTPAPATRTTTAEAPRADDAPDTREPSPERHAEMRAAYDANAAAGKPPYEAVRIRTLGELAWILREHDWSGEPRLPESKKRPDLRGVNLSGATLAGARLSQANLRDANLGDANLNGAILSDASLTHAILLGAELDSADFTKADLSDANLALTDLRDADLTLANVTGTDLSGAELRGADLRSARMDAATTLGDVSFDRKTWLGDVVWNGVPLQQVPSWPARLGDEQGVAQAQDREQRVAAYHNAARAYRGLSLALRAQGLLIPASNYRLREQVMERKALFWSGSLLGWIFSWLLTLVAGYGERPARSFFAYLIVLFSFAGAYFAVTNGLLVFWAGSTQVQPLQWYEALVLSVSAFHGRGFFQPVQSLGDPVAILAAFEAVIGLFIEITFIATFTQRFFGGR